MYIYIYIGIIWGEEVQLDDSMKFDVSIQFDDSLQFDDSIQFARQGSMQLHAVRATRALYIVPFFANVN